ITLMRMQPRREAAPCITSAFDELATAGIRAWRQALAAALDGSAQRGAGIRGAAAKYNEDPGNGPHLSPRPFFRARPIRMICLEEGQPRRVRKHQVVDIIEQFIFSFHARSNKRALENFLLREFKSGRSD